MGFPYPPVTISQAASLCPFPMFMQTHTCAQTQKRMFSVLNEDTLHMLFSGLLLT